MSRIGLLPLVWKNLARRPFRNGILVLCAAAVVGLQVAAAVLDMASRRGLAQGLARLGADLVAVPRGLDPVLERAYLTGEAAVFYMERGLEEKIASFPFVEQTSAQLFIKSLAGASCCSAWNVFLVGFEPESDFVIGPWLARYSKHSLGPDEVLVGAGLALEQGARLKFYGHEYRVAGVLEPTGMGLDVTVFIPLSTAYLMARESAHKAEQTLEIDENKISAVTIRLKPEEHGGLPLYKAAYELEMALPEITILQPDDLAVKMHHNLDAVLHTLRSAGYAVWPVAALLIGLIFAMAVNERQREIGLLRAMGAARTDIFQLVIYEALLVAAAGAAIGLAVSLGLLAAFSRLIAQRLEIPFHWPEAGQMVALLLAAALLSLGTAALAVLYPALQSSSMEPYEAIRRGE